jgi:hypothetical protein
MRVSRRGVIGAGLVVSLVATGAVALTAAASAADPPPADASLSIVEDYRYPGASDILTQYNVKLVSGDGHILFADCAAPPTGDIGLIKVYTTEQVGADGLGLVCFKVTGPAGRLALEVPGVYEIRGDGQKKGTGHKLTAVVRTDAGELPPVTVDPSGSTQVGLGADPANDPTTLLRLTVTP